jgi:hypothetical protein
LDTGAFEHLTRNAGPRHKRNAVGLNAVHDRLFLSSRKIRLGSQFN